MVWQLKCLYFLTFRVLEWLQASRLWRGGRSPADTTSSLLWKPSWDQSSTLFTSEPARHCHGTTTTSWGTTKGGQSGLRLIRPASSVDARPSAVSGRGQRGGSIDGGGGGGGGRGWGARHSSPPRDRRLWYRGVRLPAGRWRGLRPRRGKRRGPADVQSHRPGLLLRTPAASLQTEGAHLWAAQPDSQHQHWGPHGVIRSLTNQPSRAAFCFTQGDDTRQLFPSSSPQGLSVF